MNKVINYTEQDKQFYPTPKSLLEQIDMDFSKQFECFRDEHKYDIKVLEPSAGKGDIAEYLREYWGSSWRFTPRCKVECIEIDSNLQAILKDKHYPVVYNDFLTFNTYTKYDLIYMNPPFENGEEHLLKAIKMQEKLGGRVLCILNAETIRNPYSLKRKELKAKLDKYNAVIKFYEKAFCSYDSERISGVEIAVVWVDVLAPTSVFNSKVFEELDKAKEIHIETEQTAEQHELINLGLDWITAYVKQYNEQIDSGIAFFKEYTAFTSEYNARFSDIITNKYEKAPFALSLFGEVCDFNHFVQTSRYYYWKALFDNPKFSARLTSKLKSEFNSRLDEMKNYDLNEHNILMLMEENRRATLKGIEEEIIALFAEFTKYAQYDGCDNIHYYNGWKTNKGHKLNSKIIIPFYGAWHKEKNYKFHGSGFGGYCTVDGYTYELQDREVIYKLTDMSKTLNYLAKGVSGLEDMELLERTIKRNFDNGNAKNINTEHFNLTFYKKGTCHIKFRNQDLLDKFNLFASQRKGWLPPSYGKKAYHEMNNEEQAIVKEFSGNEQNYNKIYENQSAYLVEQKELLQITGE